MHFRPMHWPPLLLHRSDQGAGVGEILRLGRVFSRDNVGMITGDSHINADAPIICCTAEILANQALREGTHADVGLVAMDGVPMR